MEYYEIGTGSAAGLAPWNPNGFCPCRRGYHAGDDIFQCLTLPGDIAVAALGLRDPLDKLSLTILSMLDC
jgi:hypothetical protein